MQAVWLNMPVVLSAVPVPVSFQSIRITSWFLVGVFFNSGSYYAINLHIDRRFFFKQQLLFKLYFFPLKLLHISSITFQSKLIQTQQGKKKFYLYHYPGLDVTIITRETLNTHLTCFPMQCVMCHRRINTY